MNINNGTDTKIVILAQGKGTRLKAGIPKPVVDVAGKPMMLHILEMIYRYNPSEEVIVFTSTENKQAIDQRIESPVKVQYCINNELLGTGHALKTVMKMTDFPENNVLVLLSDRPLITAETIQKLVAHHITTKSVLTMLTTKVPNFSGVHIPFYNDGRIIRDSSGAIEANLENTELDERQLLDIKEVVPSTYIYNKQWLLNNIDNIQMNPIKNEYYLTQMVNIAYKQGFKINEVSTNPIETHGVNTQEHRLQVEQFSISQAL